MKWLALLAVVGTLIGLATWKTEPIQTFGYMTDLQLRTIGQRHNARLAARKLDGVTVPPGGVLSFNECVGSYSKDAGFWLAPVSYSGMLVPDWGGGVCQTSTTLYNAALVAGLEVLEQHPHLFAPKYVPPGQDAAVAYPGVDLRLRNPFKVPLKISATATEDKLRVQIIGGPLRNACVIQPQVERIEAGGTVHLPGSGNYSRVRNPGVPGFNVVIYRLSGERREKISSHSYPAAQRVVESG